MSKNKRPPTLPAATIRDRIVDFRRIQASELVPNPKNWRRHPKAQRDALDSLITEIGYAGASLVRQLDDGRLMLIDGELRREIRPNDLVPVLVTDLDEAEADKLLLTHDSIGMLAEADPLALAALAPAIEFDTADVSELLKRLSVDTTIKTETELRALSTQPPPKMTWALVGIPTVEFGTIAQLIEKIAAVPSAIVETTVSDG